MTDTGLEQLSSGWWILTEDTDPHSASLKIRASGDLTKEARPEIARFQQYIPVGGTVVNAGAFIGDHAAVYAELVGTTGHVWAYEPHPVSCEALRRNMAQLPQRNVTVVEAGLGAYTQPTGLGVYTTPNIGASFLTDSQDHPTYPVEVRALDDERFPRKVDFIHLDTEGMEGYVLAGARQLLARDRPTVVIEVSKGQIERQGLSMSGLCAIILALGYTATSIPTTAEEEPQLLLRPTK